MNAAARWCVGAGAAAVLAATGPSGGTARAASDEASDAMSLARKGFAAVSRRAVPAVVSIHVEKTVGEGSRGQPNFNDPYEFFGDDLLERFFGPRMPRRRFMPRFRQEGMGSGFIVSKDGYILTNHHVVGDADKITVKLKDGREFKANRIGSDAKSEVALIKIDSDNLPVLALGDSAALEIGEWVIAIGNPFGLSESITVGVVSAKGRSGMGIADYEDMIQTDAAINPGNSGGPLLNIDGKVVGINTAIFSRSGGYMGIGFAIPINMARSIQEQLVKHGKVVRGYLGIGIQDVTADLAKTFGLKEGTTGIAVTEVVKGSPAEKGNLKVEDVIVKLNGQPVESVTVFRNRIASMAPGTDVTLTLLREGTEKTVKLVAGTLAEGAAADAKDGEDDSADNLGLQVQNLTDEAATRMGFKTGEGVLVSGVDPQGPAAEKGIQPGDLITSVNRKPVTDVESFSRLLTEARKTKSVVLRVKNARGARFVPIDLK